MKETLTSQPFAGWMSRVILLVAVLPLGLGQMGCDSGESADSNTLNTGDVGLTRCSSCESLESYLKQSATRMLEAAYSEVDGCFRMIGMPGCIGSWDSKAAKGWAAGGSTAQT